MTIRITRIARRRTGFALATAVATAAALLSACTSGGTRNSAATSSAAVPVRQGGAIVVGAEQEPDCADWIATCSGAVWGTYLMDVPTLPRVFVPRKSGDAWAPVPSEVMAGEPTVSMDGGKQKVTYQISPAAVWSDKVPISSADLKYTALQIRDGKDVLVKAGYDRIESVDTPGPKTAVITFSKPYANWKALFSDTSGFLPSHLLEGKDRNAEMKDGYSFSGGPWKIESWKRGASVTLVPNPNYWGEKPKLDKVTFQFTADTAAAYQAFKSGQLDALYPTPQLDSADQIRNGLQNAGSQIDPTSGNLEALWMNNGKFPFDSAPFRQAVSYAVDRKAIVTRLYGSLGVTEPAQSFITPMMRQYSGNDFSRYTLDLGKVTSLMQGAGWAKGPDGIWVKDGKRASFSVASVAGNKRRELTEQILQQQLKTAGFELTIANTTAAELFGKVTSQGTFQLGLWALVDTFPQPRLDTSFGTPAIPSAANGNSGLNFARIGFPDLDSALADFGTNLDEKARIELAKKVDSLLAREASSLPLDAVPNILLWNRKIGGPLAINPSSGPWWNLAQWGLAAA
ncbi:ABC transporter substrate-binding protein [Amycolatopsis jejuensis]|uniref:ABC transporter substrate-binding protein n=1 Tax=Amycolatopsis jejuensis TaxID=330084 RepID=UPI000A8F0305|nr:ABC transporter substrate-binding protein [Amycolatopsis jejuensis]